MQIWAVGGGKGGTGKSLVANGLCQGLAERGFRVIIVDADYGGPNQHTYCGVRKPATSLIQFFDDRVALEDLVVETPVKGLFLIPGSFNSPSTDSIAYTQKQKLFRHLRLLKADHVVLDLGAGSNYDTLDTFLMANIQIGVITPDALAIENFYLFLKKLKFRQLGNVLSLVRLKEQARQIWKERGAHGISNLSEFIQYLRPLSPDFDQRLTREQGNLFVRVILNQVREYRQVESGQAVNSSMHKYFQINGAFAGYLRYDKDLWQQFGQDHPTACAPSFTLHHALDGVLDGILKLPVREEG